METLVCPDIKSGFWIIPSKTLLAVSYRVAAWRRTGAGSVIAGWRRWIIGLG
jgi:hypothetical protein